MDVAFISLPMVGEIANGDRAISRMDAKERALIAVVDGLGHGPGAAAVAEVAAEYLRSVPLEDPLLRIMEHLHEKLAGSRGAAATVCLVKDGGLEACAVGNVELRSTDVRIPLVFSAGILGTRVQKFHVCKAPLSQGNRLVLFSDGISSRTPIEDVRNLGPREACDAIVKKYRRKEDDATVLVADAK